MFAARLRDTCSVVPEFNYYLPSRQDYLLKQEGIRKGYFIHVVIYWKLWQVPFLH
jgi:hypothetical protein